jgi:hypothetical protein
MNKFRAVHDTDDYDTEYQCLSCLNTWAARYFGPNYCGFCGIKFEGQLESRPHDVPRWQWDRWGDGGVPWIVELRREEQQMRYPKPAPDPVWEIRWAFQRTLERDGEHAWRHHGVLRGKDCTAYAAKRWLTQLRKEAEEGEDLDDNGWPGKLLYKLERVTESERAFFAVAR